MTSDEFIRAIAKWSKAKELRFKRLSTNQCKIYSSFTDYPLIDLRGIDTIEISVIDDNQKPLVINFNFRIQNILYLVVPLLLSYFIVSYVFPQWLEVHQILGSFSVFLLFVSVFLKLFFKYYVSRFAKKIVNEANMMRCK
jgi:hypothetical protein